MPRACESLRFLKRRFSLRDLAFEDEASTCTKAWFVTGRNASPENSFFRREKCLFLFEPVSTRPPSRGEAVRGRWRARRAYSAEVRATCDTR